jgi:hypothetical protein
VEVEGLAEALEIHVVASTKRQKAQLQRPFMKSMRSLMLETYEEIVEKALKGRAAEFIDQTGELFVNGLYEAVDRRVATLSQYSQGSWSPKKFALLSQALLDERWLFELAKRRCTPLPKE